MNMHPLMSHVAAMIIQGVRRFPDLKVLLVGGGITWVPGYLWRLDYAYKYTHQGAPWLTRMPSDYFRESVYVSTYQLERSPAPEALEAALRTASWLSSRIVYASGYPNYDSMAPEVVEARLPVDWQRNIFRDNAMEFFRWPRGDTAQ